MGNYYDYLRWQNVVRLMRPALDRKWFRIRESDQKIEQRRGQIDRDTSWVHVGRGYGYDCFYWHRILFDLVFEQLEQKLVPKFCHNCFKVVVKPRTLRQLMDLSKYQREVGVFSKAGPETRKTVPELYGAYWYHKTLASALGGYHVVCKAMNVIASLKPLLDEVDEDGKTTRIVVKRGCTEFEHKCGDPATWKITPEQLQVEDLLEAFVVRHSLDPQQMEHLVWDVEQRWIEYASEHGDQTYLEYTGGKTLLPAYVTYHPPKKTEEAEGMTGDGGVQ